MPQETFVIFVYLILYACTALVAFVCNGLLETLHQFFKHGLIEYVMLACHNIHNLTTGKQLACL